MENDSDPSEVSDSEVEEIDSDYEFSLLSTSTGLSYDTVVEAQAERTAAQSLAATDGSAHGSSFSGRSLSSPTPPHHDESSNPAGQLNLLAHFLSPVHIPVLQEINTLLGSNGSMQRNEAEQISSDEDNDEQRRRWHRLGEEQKMKRKHRSPEGNSTAKRSCDEASGSKAKPKEATAEGAEGEQRVAQCPVCLEDIDEGGVHRLVALKCGHAFGESCVKRWLESQKQCCPLCNRQAKVGDIRVVFLDCCRLGSSYELAEARKEASELRSATADQKNAYRQLELQLGLMRAENTRLTDRIRILERGLTAKLYTPPSALNPQKGTFPSCSAFTQFRGQCKYMAYGEHLDLVAVSMKPQTGIFDGFGIALCSLYDQFTPRSCKIMHRHEIKDLCFHPSRKWLLTASLDCAARISDVDNMNLNPVQILRLDSKVWSCCWSQRNETNFFLGLANGIINEYDVRQTSEPVHILPRQTRLPISSLKSFSIESLGTRVSGIISPHMRNSVRLYKEDPNDETGYTAQDLPAAGSCFSLYYEKRTSSVLVSSRVANQKVKNEIWKLAIRDDALVPSCQSNFTSGGSASIISKPILCQSPSGEPWACCLDDRANTIQVFSCADGALRHTLETKDPDRVQMTQVEKIKIPARSPFALLGLSANGLSLYE